MSTPAPEHHFPWRLTGLVVLIVVAATAVVWLLLGRDRVVESPVPAVTPSATAIATASAIPVEEQRQLTILLTVRDDDRAAVNSVLLGFGGGTGFVAELLLPRDLLLPSDPPIRLEQATDPTGPQTAEQPLETLLGVQVDAIVDLDRLAWSGLIDATGARVDPLAAQQPGAFALSVDRVLKGLPYADETTGQVLTGLGSMARTTVTNEDASYLLARLGRHLRELPVERRMLPVTYLRSGPERVAVADVTQAEAVARGLFPEAMLVPGHPGLRRVVIQPAGATLGAATAARLDLLSAGFGVVVIPNEAEFAAQSSIVVPDGSAASTAAGRDVAAALGLPPTAVSISSAPDATVDVRVLLGPDVKVTRAG